MSLNITDYYYYFIPINNKTSDKKLHKKLFYWTIESRYYLQNNDIEKKSPKLYLFYTLDVFYVFRRSSLRFLFSSSIPREIWQF